MAYDQTQEKESYLQVLLENSDSALVLLNLHRKVLACNQIARDLAMEQSGVKMQEGMDFLETIGPDNREEVRQQIENVLQRGHSSYYEICSSRSDGTPHWLRIRINPTFDGQMNVTGLAIAARNITGRKLAELEKKRISETLVNHNADLEQFAYIISHNLRSPLANMIGLCSLLQDLPSGDEAFVKCLKALSTSTKKMDEVIIDLNYILHQKKEISEKKEMVSFPYLMESIVDSIRSTVQKERVTFITDFAAAEDLFTVKGYMHSIFYNLISNSIKYSRPGSPPQIEICSKKEKGKIVLLFRDNGLGFDLQSQRDKVFGLYKRFHQHVEGKGMGLFMVKTQVESLSGTISIQSEVNKGAEIRIEFPN